MAAITKGGAQSAIAKQDINRGDLTDLQWEKLQPLLPPQKPKTGRPNIDHRVRPVLVGA
jgi:hypothetical protein